LSVIHIASKYNRVSQIAAALANCRARSRNCRLSRHGGPRHGAYSIEGSMALRSRRYYRLMRSNSRRWSLISVLRIGLSPTENTACLVVANFVIPRVAMAGGFLRIVIIVLNEQPWAAATYRHQVPMNARLSVFLFRSYVGLSRNEHSRVEMYLNAIQKEHICTRYNKYYTRK